MSPIFKRNFKENLYTSNLIFYSTILVAHGYHHHSNLLSRLLHNFQDYLDKFRYQIDGDKGCDQSLYKPDRLLVWNIKTTPVRPCLKAISHKATDPALKSNFINFISISTRISNCFLCQIFINTFGSPLFK